MVKTKFGNDLLTLFFEGHIDSQNAASIEADVDAEIAKHPGCHIVIDMDELQYISSAGLRIILRIRKIDSELVLNNVSSEVYEVLDMTGFSEMMTVNKAYRKVSVEGCEQIGQGSNGLVYRLDRDTVIKVYRDSNALPDIQRERELARKAFVLGIPTAIPYDVVRVGDTYGSVFELLEAKSFIKRVNNDPTCIDECIDESVDLLKKIHSTVVKKGDMPSTKEAAVGWAKYMTDYLSKEDGDKLVSLIEAVPECDTMMHGDYHFKNIMKQGDEILLIDMDTLSVGHPVFEFSSIYLAYRGFGELDHQNTLDFLGIDYDKAGYVFDRTAEKYFGTTDKEKLNEIIDKARVVAYTRLCRRTIKRIGIHDPDGKKMIEHCLSQLHMLLSKTDTLIW